MKKSTTIIITIILILSVITNGVVLYLSLNKTDPEYGTPVTINEDGTKEYGRKWYLGTFYCAEYHSLSVNSDHTFQLICHDDGITYTGKWSKLDGVSVALTSDEGKEFTLVMVEQDMWAGGITTFSLYGLESYDIAMKKAEL